MANTNPSRIMTAHSSLDDARIAFLTSTLELLTAIEGTRVHRYIKGHGRLHDLSTNQQHLVHNHRALIATLDNQGFSWAITDEIEGITACLTEVGPDNTRDLILAEIPARIPHTTIRLAA